MNHWKTAVFFILGMLALAADVPLAGAASLSGRLLITGSSTMAPLVSAIAKRFQALHPAVSVEVQMGGSGRGIADARSGKADIGMASRVLGEAERDLYSLPIARDGITLVVHRDNPVQSLTNRQIVDIYTGKIVNWREVSGRNASILVVQAGEKYSSTELFTQYFDIAYDDIRAQRTVGDNPTRIKLLPVDGVAASSRNIRDGNFPISRALSLVVKGMPAGLAKAFIEYSVSSQVTDLVVAHDFVPYLD